LREKALDQTSFWKTIFMLSTYPGTLSAHSRRNTRVGLSIVEKVANKKEKEE